MAESSAADASTKVVYAALIGNVLVAIAKYVAAFASGSSAMFTEAIHSTADTANQILLLIGSKRSRTEPDATHAFGYGMEVYFWTFVIAVIVLLAGGAASIVKGYHELLAPEHITTPGSSLIVLALSLVFEGSSLSVGYREYKRQVRRYAPRGQKATLWQFIKISKDPNLYESLVEDSAALIGLGIAAVGVIANAYFNVIWADGAASLAIGVLLIGDSLIIAEATRSLTAGEAASPGVITEIETTLRASSDSVVTRECKTLQLGPRTILVTVMVIPDPLKTVAEMQRELALLTDRLKAVDERIVYVYYQFG